MLSLTRRLWDRSKSNASIRGFCFSRPLVVLHSDDWGRVGVRDREGYEQLRAGGIRLGEHPYDFYTLETAEDVISVHDLLKRHRDSTGRAACLVMNFVLNNLDFRKMMGSDFRQIHLLPLTEGFPGNGSVPDSSRLTAAG